MERKRAKFQEQGISRLKVKRKRKLWKWTQRNGQFYVQVCTENQCYRATLMAFYTNFATEFFHTVFTRRSVLKGTLRRNQKVIFVKSPISSPSDALRRKQLWDKLDWLAFLLLLCYSNSFSLCEKWQSQSYNAFFPYSGRGCSSRSHRKSTSCSCFLSHCLTAYITRRSDCHDRHLHV